MAEQTQGVKNKKLLLVSLALGLFVVLVYNAHVAQIRSAAKGKQVIVLRALHDLNPGDVLNLKNVKLETVSEKPFTDEKGNRLPDFIILTDEKGLDSYSGDRINQHVEMDRLLMLQHIQKSTDVGSVPQIQPPNVGVPLMIDPTLAPGDIVRPGSRVNILGEYQFTGRPLRLYHIVDYVRVVTVGGAGETGPTYGGPASPGMRSYRTITVEVAPDVADRLMNLARNLAVRVQAVSMIPGGKVPDEAGKINEELDKLAKDNKLY